jgi:two-component system sensor histidine kinase MprB
MVEADASALRRAILNLLDNAAKYGGPKRPVVVRVATNEGATEVTISIEDRGPGIAREDLPHLFEPFYRGRGAAQVHGSGLGLSLVNQIVAAHGGRVGVTNVPQGGSRFTLYLPAVSKES